MALARPRMLAVVDALCELDPFEAVENKHGQAIYEAWGYNLGRDVPRRDSGQRISACDRRIEDVSVFEGSDESATTRIRRWLSITSAAIETGNMWTADGEFSH